MYVRRVIGLVSLQKNLDSDAVDEADVVRPSLLELVLDRGCTEVDNEVDVLSEGIFDIPLTEWAPSGDGCVRLGDRETVRRKSHHFSNLHSLSVINGLR